ncbi:GGDEF domain-containing protein [Streptomyces nanshensis]|uniref:GGDEF domain-containing protein n=1 Tax=Streptomyces nanshensis TaxID=518642 RepID=A0A1E7L3C3_9ACTN|nr:GGDEF domain-containing protein [Streptomyces nanshensis]OEV10543.1 hypothetical protein AN218_16930 [Streptomyces nanshensis]
MSPAAFVRSRPRSLTALALGAFLPTLGWAVSTVKWHHRHTAAGKDGLTGVLRRPEFTAAAQKFLDTFGDQAVFCFIDVDHFKQINDTYSHAAGDAVLVELARRIQHWAGAHGPVSRDGDEFVVVTRIHPGHRQLRLDHLSELLSTPVTFEGRLLRVSASIGVAEPATLHSRNVSALRRGADVAMFEAKRAGGHAGMLAYATRQHADAPSRNGRRIGRPGTALDVEVAA